MKSYPQPFDDQQFCAAVSKRISFMAPYPYRDSAYYGTTWHWTIDFMKYNEQEIRDKLSDFSTELVDELIEYLENIMSNRPFDELANEFSNEINRTKWFFLSEGDLLNKCEYSADNTHDIFKFDFMDNHNLNRVIPIVFKYKITGRGKNKVTIVNNSGEIINPVNLNNCRAYVRGHIYMDVNTLRPQIDPEVIHVIGENSLAKKINEFRQFYAMHSNYELASAEKEQARKNFKLDDFKRKILLYTDGSENNHSNSFKEFVDTLWPLDLKKLNIEPYYVDIPDPEFIAKNLEELDNPNKYQAICIIQSSNGNCEELAQFSDDGLIDTISSMKTPIITGIGPSDPLPLCADFVNYHCNTPSEIADFICQQYRKQNSYNQPTNGIDENHLKLENDLIVSEKRCTQIMKDYKLLTQKYSNLIAENELLKKKLKDLEGKKK